MNTYYPDAIHHVIHTGETIHEAGCDIEVIYTYEDYLHHYKTEVDEHTFAFINFGSSVCKLNFYGEAQDRSLLIIGDCEWTAIDQLVATYGDYLKTDIMQVTHHGYSGGSNAFSNIYAESPLRTFCMWATNGTKFNDDNRTGREPTRDFNRVLRAGEECRHFNAGVAVTFDIGEMKAYADGKQLTEDHDGRAL